MRVDRLESFFWDVTPGSLVEVYQRLGETYFLHLKRHAVFLPNYTVSDPRTQSNLHVHSRENLRILEPDMFGNEMTREVFRHKGKNRMEITTA
jgi:hypothetical protein